jgi:hypothetical protein
MRRRAGVVLDGPGQGRDRARGELQVADVRAQVALSLYTDFENWSAFKPAALHEKSVRAMLEQLIVWSRALQPVRRA